MGMTTSNITTLLSNVKPFKTTWKVEVKVLHSWIQHSNYSGGDSLEFLLVDKTVSVSKPIPSMKFYYELSRQLYYELLNRAIVICYCRVSRFIVPARGSSSLVLRDCKLENGGSLRISRLLQQPGSIDQLAISSSCPSQAILMSTIHL